MKYLLPPPLPLPHGFETSVPVQQLKDGHQLLELEHRLVQVGLEHEPEGGDAGGTGAALASTGNLPTEATHQLTSVNQCRRFNLPHTVRRRR